jgi:hypothetical protein
MVLKGFFWSLGKADNAGKAASDDFIKQLQ